MTGKRRNTDLFWSDPRTSRTPRGLGVLGHECPERATLPQTVAPPPWPAMCSLCGRITVRKDVDGNMWCGGDMPDQ